MERRQAKRYLKTISVRFGTASFDHIGSTYDLSENGILLKSSRVFPPLTRLTLELATSPEEKIYCEGYVQWAKQAPPGFARAIKKLGMGILLVHPSNEYNRFIRELGQMVERRLAPRTPAHAKTL